MRRSTLTTGERADNLEQVKKLNKHVSECVRRANAALGEAGVVGALFTAQAVGVRARLRDACERIILMSPGPQARRMEEILWRKVFYEPLTSAKKMRKGNTWTSSEACWVHNHLWTGVAYYHQLLHAISSSAQPQFRLADLLPNPSNDEEESSVASPAGENASESMHRFLTFLGDLTRYMLDLPSPPPHHFPVRYYLQALHYSPEGGLTHSNLATVYTTADQPLLATAHYLRALTCEKNVEGAEGNLKRLLDKSRAIYENVVEDGNDEPPSHHQRMFLHTLLTLVSCFVNNRATEEVARLCQDVLVQLGKVLETYDDADNETSERTPSPAGSPPNGHVPTSLQNGCDSSVEAKEKIVLSFSLTPEAMVAVCAVLSICIQRLKNQVSSHTSMAQALLVSVLMTLVSHVTSRLEQRISLVDPSFLSRLLPETEKESDEENGNDSTLVQKEDKNSDPVMESVNGKPVVKKKSGRSNRLASLRRRRKVNGDQPNASDDELSGSDSLASEDEDDADDNENDNEGVSSEDEDEEDEEELDLSQLCSSEDDDSDEDVKIESDQEWEGLSAGEHLEFISKEGMLAAVFVACDWLKREDEVIQLCMKTADSLWTAIAKLLNLTKVDLDHLKNNSHGVRNDVIGLLQECAGTAGENSHNALLDALRITPLPEDFMLHTLISTYLPGTSKSLNLKSMELVLLRVRRLHDFGQEMAVRYDTPLWHNTETGVYSFSMDGVVFEDKKNKKEAGLGTLSREASSSPTEDDLLSVPLAKKDSRRLAGMQSLTAQWLQHEVRNLEERTARRATLGMYLVPDATVLINHLQAIKMLLSKPTHMIIIPQAVIDLLDQQKRESLGARDAIRWLEIKFRHGSRFIRAQRPHERTRLPLIKYPKRKDKEAWEWYQIVECCHYLSAQVQQNSTTVKTATVTLLTAEKHPPNSTFSHSGLTQAAGAVLEHIEEFMRKWQTSTKGHS
ncbi:nonsense-mediated mRNA decay factor SMG5-like [Cherax quadricarinatus]